MNNFIVPQRGSDPTGLVSYLFGPGRSNEHTEQRVIAAAETLGVEDGTRIDIRAQREEVLALGSVLDSHRKAMGVEVPGGFVWHCSISLPPEESTEENRLSDEQWAEAARFAVRELGFDDVEGKAPCRWVAVHHGRSVGGNEHIHLAVNLVREDGTVASTFNDRRKMSRVCAELERRFGLQAVEGRSGAGMPGLSRAEIERTARAPGAAEPDRAKLARLVRGCATASVDEADFVRRLRGSGVMVRPRYGKGGTASVVGYSVALRSGVGGGAEKDGPVWFGGGKLASDLTLPRLREHWPEPDDERREAALEEWGRRPAAGASGRRGQRKSTYGPEVWQEAAQAVGRVREQLAQVPPGDVALWAGVAREAAGVMAAWSAQLEPDRPGPLAAAAEALARSAQTVHGQPRARRQGPIRDLRGVAIVAFSASSEGRGVAGQVLLLRQMVKVVEALQEAHRARGQARQALRLAEVSRRQLVQAQENLAARAATTMGRGGSTGVPSGVGSPTPPRRRPPAHGPDLGRD